MFKKFFKKQNGAITLFVLIAILFFLIVMFGVYIASNNRYQTQVSEVDKIKDEYGKDVNNIDEIYTDTLTISDLLKVGDIVKYDTGNPNVGDNGVINCIVLYDKAYNEKNKTNYGIQIIAEDTVGDDVTLGGSDFYTARDSYNTAITTLNAKAEEYLNTVYALDARCVGSVPDNKNAEATDSYSVSSGHTSIYLLESDTNYETDLEQMHLVNSNIAITGESYWLASRNRYTYTSHSSTILGERVPCTLYI